MANAVKVHGLRETTARLRALPKELAGKRGGPVRQAAFQGAKVIEEEAQQRAPSGPARLRGRDIEPGTMRRAIIKRRHPNPKSTEGSPTEVYRVGVDNKKAYWWKFVEFGTAKMAARPFLRAAYEAKRHEAVDRFAQVLKRAVDRIEAKLPGAR